MRWKGRRRSTNVEDRRGRGGAVAGGIGGGAVVLALIMYFMTGDDRALQQAVQQQRQAPPAGQQQQRTPQQNDEAKQFVQVMLGTTEDVWSRVFADANQSYKQPKLVIFDGSTRTRCGVGQTAMGPFYCPGDQTVYMDLSFFDQLARMGGPGDFAQAYVIGHEIAHHVQNVTGIEPKMRQLQRRNPQLQNQLLVLLELQADCLAGVWAHMAERQEPILEPGDIQEGLRAAQSIGDDTLQRNSGQPVQPGKFTHGTSEQRQRWLYRGLETGDFNACDTWKEAGVQL